MPLTLLPREKEEYKLRTFHLHSSGALTMEEHDQQMFAELSSASNVVSRDTDPMIRGSVAPEHSFLETAPRDSIAPEISHRMSTVGGRLSTFPGYEGDDGEPLPQRRETLAENLESMERSPNRRPTGVHDVVAPVEKPKDRGPGKDAWAALDEHEPIGKDKPLKVGKTHKTLSNQYASTLSGISDAQVRLLSPEGMEDVLSRGGYKHGPHSTLPVFTDIKTPRFVCEKLGVSSKWSEFEDLFGQLLGDMRKANVQFKTQQVVTTQVTQRPLAIMASGLRGRGELVPTGELMGVLSDHGSDGGDGYGGFDENEHGFGDEGDKDAVQIHTEGSDPVATEGNNGSRNEIELALLNAQKSYAEVFNKHVQALHSETAELVENEYFQLHKRVSEWRTRVGRWLKEVSEQRQFDMPTYKTSVVSKIGNQVVLKL
eukprot:GHVN01083185.1.p1 GENE.GHVN01083185.1~~GHVN01083185.1.p1  ORF type:complete len:498 (-),score=53.08 GHVN01083185.1:924-2207(-)